MTTAIDNALQKFEEAKFFLELMDRVELSRNPITSSRTVEVEYTYFLSAFLNACYSATEHLRRTFKAAAEAFRKRHANFYGKGSTGGWRTRAVH